jgi:hypothetical protein
MPRHGWHIVGLWLVSGWSLVGLWLARRWHVVGTSNVASQLRRLFCATPCISYGL